jgi:zinc protease
MGDFATTMRDRLSKLTREDVNRAIRQNLSAKDLQIVIITKDAAGLRDKLLSDALSPIKYDGDKPAELLEEDKVIGARKLGISPDAVTITPVEKVFAD